MMMKFDVLSWWIVLCTVSVANILAWSWSAARLQQCQGRLDAEVFSMRRLQLLLSAGYVFGCAFRSVLPVYDVPRIAMFDTWLSSVVVGRSVATVAELCFVAQWALMLHEASRAAGSQVAGATARIVVPLILLAETCSWYSVLTTSNIGHVVEESIWGISAALMVVSLVHVWPRIAGRLRPLMLAWCLAGLVYVGFMFVVDVPMYWSRWLADEASGRHYLTLAQGLADVSSRLVVSHRWEDWHSEVAWMTLYFSVAVWLSIALVHAPPARRRQVALGVA